MLLTEYQTLQRRIWNTNETCAPERFCKDNEQLKKVIYFHKRHPSQIFERAANTPLVYPLRIFSFSYFTSRTKTLLNTTNEHEQLRKFQNFSRKKLSSVH